MAEGHSSSSSTSSLSSSSRKKDKNQHIQVFVRVRPTNHAESVGKSPTVVEVASSKDVIIRERPQDKLTKKFTFDRVFGPSSKQVDVYTAVVSPLLDEVLAGYNCTVFAYGQTGTGKTFTMEGIDNDPSVHWKSDSCAGIIPRALSHLFDELRMLENQEYTVRVSFLELYNEELFDLLSPIDEPQTSKIRIYEDASRKGAIIIHGLEEVTVHNKNEVYKILEKGSERRKTSATLMNAQSSRSHTVFSITIHIKENTVEGEDLVKIGKLHLVDLAGSENVGRSGAVKRRAMEAGNINQSLLTLGRVITALVERAPHIPYRESKLTRLLQESLGGRTKTSIIATVSPAGINLEETLSTLDYAHRAKNITNRPEINQKLSKRALLKEYTEEIERLRRDLQATRERNGVYLAHDNYNDMQTTIESQGKEIEEKINHIKALEETMLTKEGILNDLKTNLDNTKQIVEITKQHAQEQKHLVNIHLENEKKLTTQANILLNVANDASSDVTKLHEKIERKTQIEQENYYVGEKFRNNIAQQFDNIQKDLTTHTLNISDFCSTSKDQLIHLARINSQEIEKSIQTISNDLLDNHSKENNKLINNVNCCNDKYQKWLDDNIEKTHNLTQQEIALLNKFIGDFSPKIATLVETNVVDNLKKINIEFSDKMNNLVQAINTKINEFTNKFLADRNYLEDKIATISKDIENSISTRENIICKENDLLKKFELFTAEYKNLHDEKLKIDKSQIKTLKSNIKLCNNVNNNIEKMYNDQIGIKKFIDDSVSPTVEKINQDLSMNLESNWKINEDSIERSKIITEKMKNQLDNNCDELNKFNNTTKLDTDKFKQQIEIDKSQILQLTNSINQIVTTTSKNNEQQMDKHMRKIEKTASDLSRKIHDKSTETNEVINNISTKLTTTKHQVDKFIIEDLRKDQPTGSTPIKKDFKYPNQLVSTSPHERIIRRFRQNSPLNETTLDIDMDSTLTYCGGGDDDNNTLVGASSTPYNTRSLYPSSCDISSLKDNKTNTSVLIRAASTSDLLSTSSSSFIDSNNTIVRSASDITTKRDNKENGHNNDDDFIKPDLKINKNVTSRLRHPRKILASHND
ncbi:hypothetical protein HCN44_011102 [Aphidius gifuensis]|uniref:Kinesin motor domain-containing protein n=1 Tax=Aphidius gifuensis TaxID=684658 RepID=A0A834XWQ0_APHGI|nr:kinesin-like protein Klp61F [Aphidius gifuensis]KAF7993833.1 hypothetical protein HCN44_011102 [Aphidius gifuensis]